MKCLFPGSNLGRMLVLGLLFGSLLTSEFSLIAQQNAPARPVCAEDRVIIKFKPGAREEIKRMAHADGALSHLRTCLNLPAGCSLEETAVTRWARAKRIKLARQRGLDLTAVQARDGLVDLNRFLYLKLPKDLSVEECVRRLANHPLVDYVEPDMVGSGGETVPTDPSFSTQWHHRNGTHPGADIGSTRVWDITTGSTNVVVAVLDTGVATSLSEFSGRIVPGYDFANGDSDPTDDHGHGTSVAGVIAANANNGTLGVGVDWQCRVMPVKVLDSSNFGFYSWWSQGIDYAVSNGCKVINLSAGGSSSSTMLQRSIQNAISNDVIFVTITHNDSSSSIRFPGRLPEVISVGATGRNDERASFSNYGSAIDLVAPGVDIYTVNRFGNGSTWFGTSFAAPQVAGICSLMAGLRPDLTHDQAQTILTLSADDEIGDSDDVPGFDNFYGWGRLNGEQALLMAQGNVVDLEVTQQIMTDPAPVGCEIQHLVTITNMAAGEVTGLTVTNQLSSLVQYVDAQASSGSVVQTGTEVVWTVGSLQALEGATLTLQVMPTLPGSMTNTVSYVTSQELFDPLTAVSQHVATAEVDTTPPVTVELKTRNDGSGVTIEFSELMDAVSVENTLAYDLRDGFNNLVPVTQAVLRTDGRTVDLTASLLGLTGPFSISLSGIEDCVGNSLVGGSGLPVELGPFRWVPLGSVWRYLDDGSDQGTAWRAPGFDDSSWASGPAELGYGDGDEATVVSFGPSATFKYTTTYFRHHFVVSNPAEVENLVMSLRRDDGVVAFLNGTEIFRDNMTFFLHTYTSFALDVISGPDESALLSTPVSPSLLVPGTNVLAVEIHLSTFDSPDLTFDLQLESELAVNDVPPSFLQNPVAQTVVEGGDVWFDVNVAGTQPIGYSWRQDGITIVPFAQGTATLVLTNVSALDAGLYSVVVTNPASINGVLSQAVALTVLTDTDGDGMPDSWENQHGLNPADPDDADEDGDGDGLTNLEEYQGGSDPTDGQSGFRIANFSGGGSQVCFEFSAVSNRTYSVLYKDSLQDPSWLVLRHVSALPTNRVVTIKDDVQTGGQRYYRLQAPRQP